MKRSPFFNFHLLFFCYCLFFISIGSFLLIQVSFCIPELPNVAPLSEHLTNTAKMNLSEDKVLQLNQLISQVNQTFINQGVRELNDLTPAWSTFYTTLSEVAFVTKGEITQYPVVAQPFLPVREIFNGIPLN